IPLSHAVRSAIWFAPATILILQFSIIGLAAGLALVLSADRLICPPYRPAEYAEAQGPAEAASRAFTAALVVSAGLQTAIISFLTGYLALAAGLLTASAAMAGSLAIGSGAWIEDRPPDLPRSVMGFVLTVLLASMLVRMTGDGTG